MKKKTTLERFEEIKDLEVADEQGKTVKDILPYFCENVEAALQRLEAIDNANPSEALVRLEQFLNEMTYCLEHQKEYVKGYEKQIFWKYKNTLETTIKQALLKAEQDKKKATCWDIVVKKNVDMLLIKKYDNVSDYNSAVWLSGMEKLTEEEFNLLKEVLE